jgi:outer membrane immunogenic protein
MCVNDRVDQRDRPGNRDEINGPIGMKSKLILTGMAAAVLLAAPLGARAADFGRRVYREPAYVAPIYASWTGVYAGLNVGYGFGASDWDFPAVSPSPTGVLAGGTLGYNLQTGLWVWGLEGDFDWSDMKGSVDCLGGTCETKNDWFGTARLRVGYAGWNNWLPYLTGGAAMGDIKATNAGLTSASKTKFGWTAGLGIEYAFLGNWSAKLEYLYADLGSVDFGTDFGVATDNVSFTTNIVRLGVNYRF